MKWPMTEVPWSACRALELLREQGITVDEFYASCKEVNSQEHWRFVRTGIDRLAPTAAAGGGGW